MSRFNPLPLIIAPVVIGEILGIPRTESVR
jgi:hypothetical protein